MLSGVILAGGEHGISEALQLVGNETRIESQVREMQTVCQEIIVVTNEPRALLPVVPRSTRILTDYLPGCGVISGLHAAFTLSRYNHLWVIAGSGIVPEAGSARTAWKLYEHVFEGQHDATILTKDDKPIPMFGVYSRACLKMIMQLIEERDHRISELLARIKWKGIQVGSIAPDVTAPASAAMTWQPGASKPMKVN